MTQQSNSLPNLLLAVMAVTTFWVIYTSITDIVTGRAYSWARYHHISGEARCYPEMNPEGYQRCTVGAVELHCTDMPGQGCHRASDHGATSTSTGEDELSRQ